MMNTTNNKSCSPFDTFEYVAVAISSAGTGLISVVACVGVIALIFLYRKYYFPPQRLILYLAIAALLNSLSTVLRVQMIWYKSDSNVLKGICIFTAAFDHITAWSELIAYSCITIDLFIKAVFRKETYKLEKVYFVMTFIFPFTFNWVPFIHLAYGHAGAWCWIRNEDEDTCASFTFGKYLRFAIWYIPLYLIICILIVIYIVIIYKVRRYRHHYEGMYDPESERIKHKMQKEVKPLLWYPLIYFFLSVFPLVNRIHDTLIDDDPILALWVLHAIFSPLQGGFIALVYALDRQTLRRLKCAQLRAAIISRGGTKVREYPVREWHTDSFRIDNSSTRLKKEALQPSTQAYNGTGTSITQL